MSHSPSHAANAAADDEQHLLRRINVEDIVQKLASSIGDNFIREHVYEAVEEYLESEEFTQQVKRVVRSRTPRKSTAPTPARNLFGAASTAASPRRQGDAAAQVTAAPQMCRTRSLEQHLCDEHCARRFPLHYELQDFEELFSGQYIDRLREAWTLETKFVPAYVQITNASKARMPMVSATANTRSHQRAHGVFPQLCGCCCRLR